MNTRYYTNVNVSGYEDAQTYEELVADKGTPSIREVGLALPDALYLAAHQHDTCRVLVHQEVLVGRALILDLYYILLVHNGVFNAVSQQILCLAANTALRHTHHNSVSPP